MKIFTYLIILPLICACVLTGCLPNPDTDNGGDSDAPSFAQEVFPKAPPTLTVVCGEESVTAWRGTYSWYVLLENGMGTGKHADSNHPLTALERVPVIAAGDGTEVTLRFEIPTEVSLPLTSLEVRRYRTDTENYDDYETVLVDGTTLTLTEDDALYEVIAAWDVSDGKYKGTARYAFRTAEQ